MVDYINTSTGNGLLQRDMFLVDVETGERIGKIVDELPRFIESNEDYAENFGWQWNNWVDNRSTLRNPGYGLEETIVKRTHFNEFNLEGKTLLECGCGGGDDTEVLTSFPLKEIYSFDISNAVDRAKRTIDDPRVNFFQASIYDIPFPDRSFDVVYCHRVLQHTPNPVQALTLICKKVKRGGILFAHSYKRSKTYMAEWRYKYRWLTKRIPHRYIYLYVRNFGSTLHLVNKFLYRSRYTKWFAYRFVPFYHKDGSEVEALSESKLTELERLITFDALTPAHDYPMHPSDFFGTIEQEGLRILHKHDPKVSPMYCTAIKEV